MLGRHRYAVVTCMATFALFALAASALAHPLAPALLEVSEHGNGRFEVLWRVPLLRTRGVQMRVRIPEHCRELNARRTSSGERGVEATWAIDCGTAGLVDRELTIDGLVAPLSAVVRVVFEDGHTVDGLVTAHAPSFAVPAAPSRAIVVRNYLRLGLEHIATGLDHLLFVFGLILLAASGRRIFATVTAFTLGHSITLALAAFGLVRIAWAPVELAIALSVLLVAVEVARHVGTRMPPARRPWILAACFGLLHGLGFASALSDTGLTTGPLAVALLAFNVGIELGQIAFVLLVVAVARITRRLMPPLPAWAIRVPVYAMGTLAAYWCFDRAAAWWAW